MRDFIGNPFDQEDENEDDDLDLELGWDFLFENAPNPMIIAPPYEGEDEDDDEGEEDIFGTIDDDINDPDYDYFQDNDGYDSNEENMGSSFDENDDRDEVPHYTVDFSSDESEDELQYVSFSVNESSNTTAKPVSQDSSNTPRSDGEPCQGENT